MKRKIAMKNLVVLHHQKGFRLSLTKKEWTDAKKWYTADLIQTDITGTEHWNILGPSSMGLTAKGM